MNSLGLCITGGKDGSRQMCGFAGVIHWDKRPVSQEALDRMLLQLKHRGPDEFCIASPKEWVGMSHARLRVIDLSDAARQPMANEDGSVWLVYNGEIYNFQELRALLEKTGVHFRSSSDTEVVLRAYERWGTGAIPRLDGMFSAAIWDARSQELILIRDRTGKKPLFYWTDGRCLVFGSEVKALLAHEHVPREVDESIFPFLMAFGYPPTGQTCYRHIRQVPPATFLQFRPGGEDPLHNVYWKLRFEQGYSSTPDEEALPRMRALLTEAVRRRLQSAVPLGAFLSGGIDSTIVVGLMAQLLPDHPIKTFSIGFSGDRSFNETHYAQIAAKKFRTDHTVFEVTPQSFDLLERLVWHYDQPFGDSSAVPTYLLSQLTKQHVTVALNGDGGDEIFAGYTRFLAALWAEHMPKHIIGLLEGLLKTIPHASERTFVAKTKRFAVAARLPLLERYLQWTAYVKEPYDWLQGHSDSAGRKQAQSLSPWVIPQWERSAGWSPLSRLLALNFQEYLPNDLLVKSDRCSMAHGLEIRSPFLDTALLEYAATLPDRLKVSGFRTKVLLKQAFRDILPPAIYRRRKMGFGVPLGTWFRGHWRQPLQDILGSPQPCLARYLRVDRVHHLIQGHLQGHFDAGHALWLLLTVEIWLRQLNRSPYFPTAGTLDRLTVISPSSVPQAIHR